ncbi:putative aldouronate transport system permease protein [Paenibacillus sp. BK033]|uniref:ABC transporter permease n=1 Tax=Paenibacillus sp. BK033 TaxID=2512133 RepID=UPI00104F0B65|nr:ABC transporter permease subunit [Paenibacillus sp. BK033]TCM89106.1 putative aldouronate transport system permease protein [Paenibacillus sp. BK033]
MKSASKKALFKKNVPLMLMFAPALAYYLIFRYLPIGGLVISFENYNFFDGVFHSPWVGFKNFEMLFSNDKTLRIIWNTLWLSVLNLAVGFPVPIILALMINSVRRSWYKRFVQTVVYLPHFFSWVIVGGMVITLFSMESSFLNHWIANKYGEPYPFLYKTFSWVTIFVGSGVWKEMGFSTIIYLAALTSISPALYEAAALDGASKWKQTWHVTLPGIRGTIILVLILSMGRVLEVGFDQIYNLRNAMVSDISEVISTYIYTLGIQGGQFSLTTALGLFESVVAFILILGANLIAKKFNSNLF